MIGVFRSSLFNILGELSIGLSNSDGKPPDPGVCNDDAELARLSKPAAQAIVAVAVAEAIVVCCRV